MRYEFQSGYENFKKAQRTFIRAKPRRVVLFHLKMWGYTCIGALLLACCTRAAFRPGFHLIAFMGYLLGCGLLGGGVFGAAIWQWQRKRAYRLWNGEEDVLDIYLEVEGPTLITGRPGRAESRLQRATVCDFIEDDQMLLLLLSKKKFIYFPKSIGEQAIAEVRGWLELPGAPPSC